MRPTSRSVVLVPGLLVASLVSSMGSVAGPPSASAQTFCDYAPEVRVKDSPVNAAVGVTARVVVTAEDPNGDVITSLTADTSFLPAGNDAVFVPNASNTGGELTWTPEAGQTGTFSVPFFASNALTGSASASIRVIDTAGAPFVQAPATVYARVFENTTFDVYAGDPDGEPIASLAATGLPPTATFTPNAANTVGTFSWTPDFSTEGGYEVTFTATSSSSGSATTFVSVPQFERPPVITVPPLVQGTEGSLLTICALASSPEDDPIISFTVSPQPPGVQVDVAPGNRVLTLRWTPSVGQAGTYDLAFTASTAALSTQTIVQVIIAPASGDRPPVVSAPASVSGYTGAPLTVDVTASDPDGDAITSLTAAPLPSGATFDVNGPNTAGTLEWTPGSLQAGTYEVTFTAENALAGGATTTIQVTQRYDALVFTSGADKSIRLASNRSVWCADVEPLGNSFAVTDIDPATLVLLSPGTGSVGEIPAQAGKIVVVGDENRNGVPDMKVCFLKDDLRALFDGLSGKQTVVVSLEGDLVSGARIHGDLTIDVYASGGQLAASLAPNPPGDGGTLRFTTKRPGPARVRVFDVRGRLIRTLLDERDSPAGTHAVRMDARGTDGVRLPSGVYFYRIEAAEGSASGRFALLR